MYETKDSYFFIFDPTTLIIVGMVIVLAIAGFFFFSNKKEIQRRSLERKGDYRLKKLRKHESLIDRSAIV